MADVGCVYFHPVTMPWSDARTFCQDMGADLLVPSDYNTFLTWGENEGLTTKGMIFLPLIHKELSLILRNRHVFSLWKKSQKHLSYNLRYLTPSCTPTEPWLGASGTTWLDGSAVQRPNLMANECLRLHWGPNVGDSPCTNSNPFLCELTVP